MAKAGSKTKTQSPKNISWNLGLLFDSDTSPLIAENRGKVKAAAAAFVSKWRHRRDYLQDPLILRKALDDFEQWSRNFGYDGDEGYYFWLRTSQDQNSSELKAAFNKVEEFGRKIEDETRFFYMRICKIPVRRQKEFLEHPRLAEYRHFLERAFAEARYLMSEAEEKIISAKASTSHSNWVRMTSGFLVREERDVVLEDGSTGARNFSEILNLMNSANRRVRDSAAKAFNAILAKHALVAEAEINSILANKKSDDEFRKIPRPDLSRHISDDMESEVVDTLIGTVAGRFDIPAEFYRLKAGLLKVRKLKYHERNVEYGIDGGSFPYDKSATLVRKVFSRLDPEFVDIFDGFMNNGQIDVYPQKGKTSGAFCAHNLISQPTYILLNHTDSLNDVLTLAHELGHGINNELMKKSQHALHFGAPLSTAEVASTFMEDFVLQEILREADEEQRLALMVKKLNDDVSTIFRQVACYRFEQELHFEFRKKGYLSVEEIGAIFSRHMAAYMGDAVEQSGGAENWWIYWGHIRTFFYVYSYASGLLISKAMQRYVKEDPRFIGNVKTFLSAGLSDSPRNIFRSLGIDIAGAQFWKSGLDEVEALLNETIALAKKLKKIK
jgi:oligoendopeptidase F